MDQPDERTQQVERRNFISSVFIGILIAVAYQEMVPPVRNSVRANGITLGTSVLFLVFFLTSMRFFIGNQFHLVSSSLARLPGKIWFYDFTVIVIQTAILIFMGGICSLESCVNARIGFVDLLLVLYIIDVLWISSQWALGKLLSSWQRPFIPWAWAILNTALVVGMVILRMVERDFYCPVSLGWLGALNTIAFVIDVVLVDYYGLF
jgi:hypothetical protein